MARGKEQQFPTFSETSAASLKEFDEINVV
jgi:hypothetical protein